MMPERSNPWQSEPAETVGPAVVGRAKEIEAAYQDRYSDIETAYDLYEHQDADIGINVNVLAEAIEALAAELTQDPVHTVAMAVGLDYEQRQGVRMTQWYLDAAYHSHRVSELHYLMVRDAGIAGTGYCLVVDGDDGPEPERIHPQDVLVDDAGCSGRVEPPELLIRRRLPRERAKQLYPELAEEIARAPRPQEESQRDVIETYLAWYDAGEEDEGRMVVALDGCDTAAIDEPWHGRPPWGYLRIVPPTKGLAGISPLLRAASLQAEYTRLLSRIQDAMVYAVPRLFYQDGTIDPNHLETSYGTDVPVAAPPQQAVYMHVPSAANPEVYAQLDRLRIMIYRAIQANETFAQGEVPQHLKSGVAVMNYREVRNRRLLPVHREIEWAAVRLSEELLRAEARAGDRGQHRVRLMRSGTLREVPFGEVVSDLDSIQLTAQPVSAFASTVPARIELLQGMYSEGLISAEDFHASTTDVVDLETVRRRITASRDVIEDTIDGILRTGEVRMPESYLDLALAVRVGRDALLRAQLDEVPGDRLTALRSWLEVVASRLAEQQAPPPAPAGPAGPAPMPPGPPMPPGGGNGAAEGMMQ